MAAHFLELSENDIKFLLGQRQAQNNKLELGYQNIMFVSVLEVKIFASTFALGK